MEVDLLETAGGGATGTTGTLREYIYLPETEISPTRESGARVDRPLGVVNAVNTATPVLWMVHVDHLNRPVRMTDGTKAAVWDAIWLPRVAIVRAISEGVNRNGKQEWAACTRSPAPRR